MPVPMITIESCELYSILASMVPSFFLGAMLSDGVVRVLSFASCVLSCIICDTISVIATFCPRTTVHSIHATNMTIHFFKSRAFTLYTLHPPKARNLRNAPTCATRKKACKGTTFFRHGQIFMRLHTKKSPRRAIFCI